MEVPRLEEPVRHLTSPLPVIERALLARAKAIEEGGPFVRLVPPEAAAAMQAILVAEFRALAEELHHWR